MNDRRTWFVAGVLFLAAAVLSLVTGNTVPGVLMGVAGVLMLLMPQWQGRHGGRRRRP